MRLDSMPVDDPWTSREHDLANLADVLPFLLLRDDEQPARWLTPAFGEQVALVRTQVARIPDGRRVAARLETDASHEPGSPEGRFERASRRLASDPAAVALVIRWLEIEADTRLPSWSDILRGRALRPTSAPHFATDASFWFG